MKEKETAGTRQF